MENLPEKLKSAKSFHSHLGPNLVIGLKMGESMVKRFGNRPFSIKIKAFTGKEPPVSCVIDGLQLSTPATVGNGGIEIAEGGRQEAVALSGGRRLRISLRPEVRDYITSKLRGAGDREMEEVALEIWEMTEEELFEIDVEGAV